MAGSQVASKCSFVPSFQPQQVCLRSSKPERSESLAPSQLGRPKDLRIGYWLVRRCYFCLILYHCITVSDQSQDRLTRSGNRTVYQNVRTQNFRSSECPEGPDYQCFGATQASTYHVSCVQEYQRCTRGTCTISSSFPRARALWPLDNTLAAITCFLDWWDEFGSLRYGPQYALASWRHAKA